MKITVFSAQLCHFNNLYNGYWPKPEPFEQYNMETVNIKKVFIATYEN